MPQLFSRMDEMNWLTPSIADILDQGAAPPNSDGSMREMITELQEEFSRLETPAKVINVRPTPSYTLFLLQPETIGRLGSRRMITPGEIRRSVGQIADRHKDWRLGFMAQLDDAPEAIGLLVRTDKHRPLSLRRLLIRSTFRDYPSSLAFTLGNTLEQRLIVRDLEETPHLLLIGESTARQHLISSMLLTLTLLNTPGELRVIMAGNGTQEYEGLNQLPHIMGNPPTDAETLLTALTQLMTESQSRLDRFYEEGVNQFRAYNARLREQNKVGLPRIIVTFDPFTDEAFKPALDRLAPLVRDLLVNGAQVGIHIVFAVNQASEVPSILDGLFTTQVIMRSAAAADMGEKVKNWHASLLRFIDAFIVERNGVEITPVELCAVAPEELTSAVDYWKGIVAQRQQAGTTEAISGRTGLTGVLTPVATTPPAVIPALTPQFYHRAAMLAAYLGWLSAGALRDIFGLSETDAFSILQQLQKTGVIEEGDNQMLRFVRLAEQPEEVKGKST